MKKYKQNLEQKLADVLSEYVDSLNEGTVISTDKFLSKYGPLSRDLEPILKTVAFIKEKTQTQIVTEEDKIQAFEKVHAKFLAQEEKEKLRKDIEHGTAKIPLDKRSDFLILLLNSLKEIWGKTRVVKYLFLMKKEEHLDKYIKDYYEYYAYDFGPFEKAIYEDIEVLKNLGIIGEKKPPKKVYKPDEEIGLYSGKIDAIYSLTDRGSKIAQAIVKSVQEKDPDILRKIEIIKSRYGHLSLEQLIMYIYKHYPKYAEASIIKEEMLEANENGD